MVKVVNEATGNLLKSYQELSAS